MAAQEHVKHIQDIGDGAHKGLCLAPMASSARRELIFSRIQSPPASPAPIGLQQGAEGGLTPEQAALRRCLTTNFINKDKPHKNTSLTLAALVGGSGDVGTREPVYTLS